MTPEQLKKIDLWKPGLALVAIVFMVLYLHECGRSKDSDLSKNAKISRLEQKDRENEKVQAREDSLNAIRNDSLVRMAQELAEARSLYLEEKKARKQDRRELFALRAASGVRVDTVTLLIEGNFQAQIDADSIQMQKLEARILSDSTNYTGIIQSWVTKLDSQVQVTEGWRLQAVKSTQDAQKFKRQRNTAALIAVLEALLIVLIAVL